jgi:hypothetical protein
MNVTERGECTSLGGSKYECPGIRPKQRAQAADEIMGLTDQTLVPRSSAMRRRKSNLSDVNVYPR